MRTRFLLAACIATALACPLATAQTSSMPGHAIAADAAPAMKDRHIVSAFDRSFVSKASAADLADARLGKLALSQGTNSMVKSFGQRMITDHTATNRKLKVIATEQSLQLSTALSPAARKQYAAMKYLADATFDHAYARNAVQDQQHTISLFNGEVAHGRDPALRSYALQTLPTLKKDLMLALKLPQG